MNGKKGTFLIRGGLLLIAAAFILTGYNIWDDKRAHKSVQSVLGSLNEALAEPQTQNSGGEIPDYLLYPEMNMPVTEIDGEFYIGLLSMPSIEAELPVMSDWSYEKLKTAPCRYSGSAYLDTLVIAAHNYSSHFGRLKELKADDKVTFTDADGNVFNYCVAETEILLPTDIEKMVNGDWDMTLFTCTTAGKARIAVRCLKEI